MIWVMIMEGWRGIYSAGGCAWVGYLTAIEHFGWESSGLFDEKFCTNQGACTVDCIDQGASYFILMQISLFPLVCS